MHSHLQSTCSPSAGYLQYLPILSPSVTPGMYPHRTQVRGNRTTTVGLWLYHGRPGMVRPTILPLSLARAQHPVPTSLGCDMSPSSSSGTWAGEPFHLQDADILLARCLEGISLPSGLSSSVSWFF